jgi:hypothetical protein
MKKDKIQIVAELKDKVITSRNRKRKPETKEPLKKMLERIEFCEKINGLGV